MNKIKKESNKIYCSNCDKMKTNTSFYVSRSPVAVNGRYPICKLCLSTKLGSAFDHDTFKKIVNSQLEIGFYGDKYVRALVDSNCDSTKMIGAYMKLLNKKISQDKTEDTNIELNSRDLQAISNIKNMFDEGENVSDYETGFFYRSFVNPNFNEDAIEDIADDEIALQERWGGGAFSPDEMKKMEMFYNKMITSFVIETPPHYEMLETMAKINVLRNRAIEEGNVPKIKQLSETYAKILQDGGFRPIDKISISEQAGVRSFSEIFEEIERDGFIEPYPLEENKDVIDKTILVVLNHYRKLHGVAELIDFDSDNEEEFEGEWAN